MMPDDNYNWQCYDCGHKFSGYHNKDNTMARTPRCPKCNSDRVAGRPKAPGKREHPDKKN